MAAQLHFWAFLLKQKLAGNFAALQQIMVELEQAGLDIRPLGMDKLVKSKFGSNYGLDRAYWDWAKNQAFERKVALGDHQLTANGQCSTDPSLCD
jgi:hypothetical protein